nr:MAG TPA: hypothetical protein [Caudoviricetes sp.]
MDKAKARMQLKHSGWEFYIFYPRQNPRMGNN